MEFVIDTFTFIALKVEDEKKDLVIESKRLKECISYCQLNNIKRVYIRPWSCESLDFLHDCPQIESIFIQGLYKGVEPLYTLPELKELVCENDELDFARLHALEHLNTNWRPVSGKTLHFLRDLKTLRLNCLGVDYIRDAMLPESLRELTLVQSRLITLDGIELLARLTKLELSHNSKLAMILPLKDTNISELNLEKCRKVQDLLVIKEMKKLRFLRLTDMNDLQNISFIREMPRLEGFGCVGTAIRNGDMTPLFGLKHFGIYPEKKTLLPLQRRNPGRNSKKAGYCCIELYEPTMAATVPGKI